MTTDVLATLCLLLRDLPRHNSDVDLDPEQMDKWLLFTELMVAGDGWKELRVQFERLSQQQQDAVRHFDDDTLLMEKIVAMKHEIEACNDTQSVLHGLAVHRTTISTIWHRLDVILIEV